MKQFKFKTLLPHLIAIVLFIAVAAFFCKDSLSGKVLQQSDITNWKGAIHNSEQYAETHNGNYPLWTNGVFSGMPAFQIGGVGGNYVAYAVHSVMTLGLPKPMQFFFLACICFYILCVTLRVNPYLGIMGALAFGYATYNPVIISVGHDTKMLSIAYMPAVLAGVLLIFEKKYWLGALLTALFSSAMIAMNHVQIAYYLFTAIGLMTIFYIVKWIMQKEIKHLLIAGSLALVATVAGVLSNATLLMSTYEYQKETIRGGGSVLTDSTKANKSTTGLDKDYVFSYSFNISEPFVLMVPKMFGGSTDKAEIDSENSKAIEAMSEIPQQLQQQLPMQYYWGGMTKPGEVGTSGPPYAGAIICMLAIFSFFMKGNKHRWWILGALVLSIIMSWGSYFDGFNGLLYKYLPFYNKFRAPSMMMVIPQLLLSLSAVLFVQQVINAEDKKTLWPSLTKGAIATGSIFVLLFLMYFMFDFMSGADADFMKQAREMNQPQLMDYLKTFYAGLKADRQSLMMGSILRSLGFILLAAGLLFLYMKKILNATLLSIGLALFALIDVSLINTKYLNSDNYQEKENSIADFSASKADLEIQQDKSDYRVFNVAGSFSENITSYYYKSVGGYHPAKLRIYQDLIERQLSKQEINFPVLNMLNTKYLIQKDRAGVTQQYQKNEAALGPCWLVKQVVFVKDADAEMKALDNFNPKDTAFVQDAFKAAVPFMPQYDSSASVKLVKNDNDKINYSFNAATSQFAVFSEIYYKAGWKAFIDGKESPIVKVNYVLRGLAVPAGKHDIEFRFEPQGYLTGKKLAFAALVLCIAFLVVWLAGIIKNKGKQTAADYKD
jgi:Bacterial membrane protein YfhO